MPKSFSLNTREAIFAGHTSEGFIVLVTITHPNIPGGPVLLSGHNTQRLSSDPLIYGTVSNGDDYQFVIMNIEFPDDRPSAPENFEIVFENVSTNMALIARSTTSPADITLQVVLMSDPDDVQEVYDGYTAVGATYTEDSVTLQCGRDDWTSEPCPSGHMSRSRFPGLFG